MELGFGRRVCIALAVSLIALVLPVVSPAAAHDALVSSSPKDGATLTKPPGVVRFTFSGLIQSDFAQVAVVTRDGQTVISGEPVVDGTQVRMPLPPLSSGDYTASFRVVSSDGHPIDGSIGFTVATAPSPEPAPADASGEASTDTPDATVAASPIATDETETAGDAGEDAANTPVSIALLLGLAAAAAIVFTIAIRLQRREQAKE